MVQEYQSPVRVYKYPFEIVMAVSEISRFIHGISMKYSFCIDTISLHWLAFTS